MWRATLELLDFLPLANVDYAGGIVTTDWYNEGASSAESLKITVRFLSNSIRADGLKIIVHKKKCDVAAKCSVKKVSSALESELKVAILQKAASLDRSDRQKNKNFRPKKQVTRRELMRLVVKLLKLERPSRIKENPFYDVKSDDKDAGYILAGVEEGIMFAFPDGTFKPDKVLTVAEAFEILVNNDILDTDDVNVDRSPCTRLDLAQMMKSINQYNERVEYLLNWDKGFKLN